MNRRVAHPGVAPGHHSGVAGQLGGKVGLVEGRVAGAAAVVHQAHNGLNAQPLRVGQALVGPVPVGPVNAVGGPVLPEHGVAQGAQPQPGKAVEVGQPVVVPAARELVGVGIAHPPAGAFDAAPAFDGVHYESFRATEVPGTRCSAPRRHLAEWPAPRCRAHLPTPGTRIPGAGRDASRRHSIPIGASCWPESWPVWAASGQNRVLRYLARRYSGGGVILVAQPGGWFRGCGGSEAGVVFIVGKQK